MRDVVVGGLDVRRRRSRALARAVLASLVLAGCASPASPVSPRAAAPSERWATMSWEERHDLMTFDVLPNMARTFQHFRRSSDPELTCHTCHGKDAERVAYKMPHGLTALDPAHMPDPDARTVRFMTTEVMPQMASILGLPVYDPATKTGFGCFNCHPTRGG